jgi:UDP:flavonoid glycosyltransferase YjiC (YdhE family)
LLPDVPDVPTALQRFVRVNQPFMLVTHGGFLHPYAHNVVQRAVACAHELGLRALVVLPEDNDVLTSDERTMVWHQPVSAAAVIAAAAVVVHPGGAGTTQRVVRAGVPGVPVALYPSDVLWAEQCFRVQLTPTVLHAQTVTHNALSDAIAHAVTDVAYRYQARALATEMAREDGLAQLIQTIRPYIGTP